MEYLTRFRGRLGLNSIAMCEPDGTVLASATSSRGIILILRWSASENGSKGGPAQPASSAPNTNFLADSVITATGSPRWARGTTDRWVHFCSAFRNLFLAGRL